MKMKCQLCGKSIQEIGGKFPDYLGEQISDSIEKLSKEVLK